MSALPVIPDHTLLRPIGRGAYGEVWLARNVMGALRAVKIIWRRQFDSERPFEREFAGIQRYEPVSRSSGGLVHVLHVGRNEEEGYFFYVMELADAADRADGNMGDPLTHSLSDSYTPRTLRADLKRHERLPTADCLRLALDVVSGLAQLHRHGLVHRDVKPGNIIYVNNRAKLADIGLVSAGGEARTFVGTEGYIPPEGPGSPRADLYALGIALYEASTGFPPERFPDVPSEWLAEGATDDALEFHEVILKACEAQREHSYQTAEQMQADLALLQSGQSLTRMRAMERRYARLRLIGLVGATLLACALAGFFFANYRARVAAASRARETGLRQQAEEALFKSRLAEAAASRRTGRAGQRFDALAAISDAARLKPGSPELRDEAIAALATVDVREVWRQPLLARIYHVSAITDGAMHWMVDATNDFILRVRDLRTWNTLGTFPKGPDLIDRIGPVSPDGKFLRVRYMNGDRWVWDVHRCEPVLKNPAKEFVEGGGFARDGFVSLTKHGDALWQSLDGPSNRVLANLTVQAAATLPSPDGTAMLVVNSSSDLLTLVSLDGGKTNINLAAPPGTRFTSAAWSPDGRRLAGAASNFRIYIWDARTNGPPLATLRGHTAEVVALAFHPDGGLLATGSWDNTTRLWDWIGERTLLQWDGSTGWLWFSDDGTRLTFNRSVASERAAFIALEVAWPTACRTFHEPRPTDNPSGNKGPRGAAFSPDGRSLATATWDGVRCYDPRDGSLTRWTPSPAACVSFAGQPLGLFAAGMEGAWRQKLVSESGAPLWDNPRPFPKEGVRFIAVSSDGETIAMVVRDKVELQRSDASSLRLPGKPAFEEVAVSADGKWVAAAPIGGTPGEVHLWTTAHATLHHRFPATRLAHIAFDPTGTRLAINHGESLTVWNTETGQPVWEVPRGERFERVGGVAYSADGRLLAACVSLRSVVLVAADDGRIVARLEAPHGSAPGNVAFSPDGSQLAVMLADHEWQLWDLSTLRTELARLGLNWDEGAAR